MLFNSYAFLLGFLPITLTLFYVLLLKRGSQSAILSLGLCSLFFYAWWDVSNLPLFLGSIVVNFLLAYRMATREGAARKRIFILGICVNLLALALFKYSGFITSNLHSLSSSVPVIHFALPLAISFFTFQQLSFLRGVYSQADYVPNWMRYMTFISFFPHLIAGPILHHKDIAPQMGALKREIPWAMIYAGIALFTLGLFKKVMIADPIGLLADPLYAKAVAGTAMHMIEGWSAALLYGFQLYFDFSGYSDMAIGLAAMFGITFPKNFASPYRARNIADFWRRWHITLSQFLRDFVYIPLGGNRSGIVRTLINLTITMALGGLWHGASWNFVYWGLLHGAMLAICTLWGNTGITLARPLAWAITFLAIMAVWVLFRAPDMDSALIIYHAMITLPDAQSLALVLHTKPLLDGFAWISAALLICLTLPTTVAWVREGATMFHSTRFSFGTSALCHYFILILFLAAFLHISRLSIFLYFNF